jgi:hypothetical protein
MAEVIDTRNSDGYLVVLGNAITLPNSSTTSNSFPPYQGSIRWNPGVASVQFFNGTVWTDFGGGGGGGLGSVTLSGDATGTTDLSGNLVLTLASVATAGVYSNITINAKGLVTHASALTNGNITTALGYTPANLISPVFTGTPTAPTPATTDNSQNLATTAYVQANLYKQSLTGSTTFYVAPTGNNSNTGVSASPFATVTYAYSNLVNRYNLNGHNVYISVENGSYTESIVIAGSPDGVSTNSVSIVGNNSNPATVTFAPSSGAGISISNGANVNISGFSVQSANSSGVLVQSASAQIGNMAFGSCTSGFHAQAGGAGSYITFNAPCFITAPAKCHLLCGSGGAIELYNTAGPITISGGTLNFPQGFAVATSTGTINVFPGFTYVVAGGSSVTGPEYVVEFNGVITTNGGGTNFFPGSSAGTSSTGGQYGA